MTYSSLEKKFDELTPSWIVSTSKPIEGILNEKEENRCWRVYVRFNGKVVHKTRTSYVDGVAVESLGEFDRAIPDFVIMSKERHEEYCSMLYCQRNGLKYENPFERDLKGLLFVELFGEYYHSGKAIGNISKEEHEKEVLEAYKSAGADVLILWEKDVHDRWDEFVLPKLMDFIKQHENKGYVFPEWDKKKVEVTTETNIHTWRSLCDPEYWRSSLDCFKKNDVVENLVKIYSEIEFPYPDLFLAKIDFYKFNKWCKNNDFNKTTRFGLDCCRSFIREMSKAKVKGNRSLCEVWKDKELMRKAIFWQLEKENGSHHAKRFLDAMGSSSGFRIISNLKPGHIVMWMNRYFGGNIRNKIFYDPCAGWGGRMLAAHGLGMKYYAMDANKKLVEELNNMAQTLGIDAVIKHGDSSNEDDVKNLMGDVRADYVFTSPPYFDKEIYGDDEKQSIIKYPTRADWDEKFCLKMVKNALNFLKDDGKALFNVHREFNSNLIEENVEFYMDDFDVNLESRFGNYKERVLFIDKSRSKKDMIEGIDYVECKICHRRHSRLRKHISETHKMSEVEYLEAFPGSILICKRDSESVARNNENKEEMGYTHRTAFRCKDGSIVFKKDAWLKSWGKDTPPISTILEGEELEHELKRLKDLEKEGINFVTCKFCGYKSNVLTRHLKEKHNIEPNFYDAQLRSEESNKKLTEGANKAWDTKGRKPRKEKDETRGKKFTKEQLEDLYTNQKLSKGKIAEMFGLSEVAVSYYMKKFGIEVFRTKNRKIEGKITMKQIIEKYGIKESEARYKLKDIPHESIDNIRYFDINVIDDIFSVCKPPEGYLHTEELSELVQEISARDVRKICLQNNVPMFKSTKWLYFEKEKALEVLENEIEEIHENYLDNPNI